jgi:hypothetical protein
VCVVCGSPELVRGPGGYLSPYRCGDHANRNPCVIEGCTKHTAADGQLADNQWFCIEHWRRYVPARSLRRRTYNTYFRQAKRYGWNYRGKRGRSPRLDWRFRRFWQALVDAARRRSTEGHVDHTAINRLFGWEE